MSTTSCARSASWVGLCCPLTTVPVGLDPHLRLPRRPHTHPRLRANPRGSHAGVRQELAQGDVTQQARSVPPTSVLAPSLRRRTMPQCLTFSFAAHREGALRRNGRTITTSSALT